MFEGELQVPTAFEERDWRCDPHELGARGERVVCVCAIDGRGFPEMLSEIGEIFAGGVAQTGAEDIL